METSPVASVVASSVDVAASEPPSPRRGPAASLICGWVRTCRILSFCLRHVPKTLHPCHLPRLDPTRVARCIDRMPLKAMPPTSPPVGRVVKVPSLHFVQIRMDVRHPFYLQLRVVRALLLPSTPTLLWVLMHPHIIWGAQSILTILPPIIFITIWGVCLLLLPYGGYIFSLPPQQ